MNVGDRKNVRIAKVRKEHPREFREIHNRAIEKAADLLMRDVVVIEMAVIQGARPKPSAQVLRDRLIDLAGEIRKLKVWQ